VPLFDLRLHSPDPSSFVRIFAKPMVPQYFLPLSGSSGDFFFLSFWPPTESLVTDLFLLSDTFYLRIFIEVLAFSLSACVAPLVRRLCTIVYLPFSTKTIYALAFYCSMKSVFLFSLIIYSFLDLSTLFFLEFALPPQSHVKDLSFAVLLFFPSAQSTFRSLSQAADFFYQDCRILELPGFAMMFVEYRQGSCHSLFECQSH